MVQQIVLTFFAILLLPNYTTSDGHNKGWWKNAVFYQIYPRSFKDSNNDGIGDLKGLISKLNYLKDTGIDALWLSPIYPSPGIDSGYDVSNYIAIDPEFGTIDDFQSLLAYSKQLGLKVILDFVPNHSSNQHEWFKKSQSRTPGYENYYIWLDGKDNNTKPPNNWISKFHGSAWEYSTEREQWYLHQYAKEQPDLNYRKLDVVNEMKKILTFWLDKGVDGFRVDAVNKLFENDGYLDEPLSNNTKYTENDYWFLLHPYTIDQPETLDMLYQWRTLLDNYTDQNGGEERILITEAHSNVDAIFKYYGNETHKGAQFSFNFLLMNDVKRLSNASDVKEIIDKWINNMPKRLTANWVLGNHDQHRVASRLGAEKANGFTIMQMFLPGVAVTYQGEEIGMEDGEITWQQVKDPKALNGRPEDFKKNSRDFERTPFQWNVSVNAGFNEGAETWLPVGSKYRETNLAAQITTSATERTPYNNYRKLLKLRKKSEALKNGDLQSTVLSDQILLLTREVPHVDKYILLINLNDKEETVQIPNDSSVYQLVLTNIDSKRKLGDTMQINQLRLDPFECLLMQEGKFDCSYSSDSYYFIIFTIAFICITTFIVYATIFYTKNFQKYEYSKLTTIQEIMIDQNC